MGIGTNTVVHKVFRSINRYWFDRHAYRYAVQYWIGYLIYY